mgnify:CR=1 FL=1
MESPEQSESWSNLFSSYCSFLGCTWYWIGRISGHFLPYSFILKTFSINKTCIHFWSLFHSYFRHIEEVLKKGLFLETTSCLFNSFLFFMINTSLLAFSGRRQFPVPVQTFLAVLNSLSEATELGGLDRYFSTIFFSGKNDAKFFFHGRIESSDLKMRRKVKYLSNSAWKYVRFCLMTGFLILLLKQEKLEYWI